MLLPYTTLEYYGPATGAMVSADALGDMASAVPHQRQRFGLTVDGIGNAPVLRPYRGRNAAVSAVGTGSSYIAAQKRVRAALAVLVSALSQDDVTGSVWDVEITPGTSFRQAMIAALSGGIDYAALAAAVLAAAAITPIAADIKAVKGQSLAGSGIGADPWGPA